MKEEAEKIIGKKRRPAGRGESDPKVRLPVIAHETAATGQREHERIAAIAARLIDEEPALAAAEAFGPAVRCGPGDGPALLIGDHSEIALATAHDTGALDYRMLLLGRSGDTAVIHGPRCPPFEAYLDETLGLGRADVRIPGIAGSETASLDLSLPLHCLRDEALMASLAATAREQGRIGILPYISTDQAWLLADAIATRADGAQVDMCGAPPRLTRRVNDKLWFAQRVIDVLGERALPPSYHAYGPAALAGRVDSLLRTYGRVVVKVPDSASSAGNVTIESARIDALGTDSLRDILLGLLGQMGWRERYPLMVGVWDCPVVSSPSVQVWIPERSAGPPLIEGIFEQVVEGERAAFVGAGPAEMPPDWRRLLAHEAMQLARLFQMLGYFGRMSFDAVIAGSDYPRGRLHWIECNGRWGGVSLPMTLVNRLAGDWQRRPFVVVQQGGLDLPPRGFERVMGVLESLLFRPGEREEGIVILTPTAYERGTGIHFAALAGDAAPAKALAANAIERILAG